MVIGGVGGCPLCSQNVTDLMLKKKLLPLVIELTNFKLFMFCCDKNFYFFILENIIIQLFVDRNKPIFKILLNDIFCHKKLDHQSK